ncbi:MAG: cyclically-permuted mutarotase family protein [Bacteroides sp.]
MVRTTVWFFLCILVGLIASCNSRQATLLTQPISIQEMIGIPDAEPGFASGVSACYAGAIDDLLLVAGGCNFPDLPLTAGGKKRYYKGIYVANRNVDSVFNWRKVGELPVAAAYGVSIPIPGGLIFAGGMNEEGSLSSVYRLRLSKDKQSVIMDTLHSLPFAIDNMAGVVVGERLFLIGGNVEGKPSCSLLSAELSHLNEGWLQESSFPGDPRIQPVCAAQSAKGGSIYMWGGFAPSVDGVPATLSTDGYAYSIVERSWKRLAMPTGSDSVSVSLGGGGAVSLNDSLIICTGGVNKSIFLSALRRGEMLQKAKAAQCTKQIDSLKAVDSVYLSRPADWYCFNDKVLLYNVLRDSWTELSQSTSLARAGAALVGCNDTLFSICGELKPGVRTPEINRLIIRSY